MVDFSQIYKATYSGVPVYEMNCKGVAVMRRQSDSYLNATQILKVADFDKPQRTRILEREVQTGQHEKVQGGYGKYQGTWVPFERGKALAELYEVDNVLAPILQFVKGDQSPPLAPKHVTAATARPRKSRESRIRKKPKHFGEDLSDVESPQTSNEVKHEETKRTRKARTKALADFKLLDEEEEEEEMEEEIEEIEEDVGATESEPVDNAEPMDYEYNEKSYAQRLLQYFMSNKTNIPSILSKPPRDMDLNVIIDDEGHTSLHWAAAMARIKIVKLLIENGADIYRVNYKGQTALMRSVLFTNNFDLKTFDSLVDLLRTTIFNIDKKDQTVFHHTAAMSDWKGKIYASRYYMECLINKLKNNQSELISILNVQDVNGDTALTIAAKIGNRRLIKLLIDAGASTEIANEEGMAPKDYFSDIEKSMMSCNSISLSSPPTASSSPSESENVINEADTRELLRARVEAMFKNVTSDPNSAQPISEVFDEFAESYERDLIHKERLLDKKKIELELYTKRLDETKRVLDSVGLNDDEEKVKAYIENVENDGRGLEQKYRRWLAFSQKETLLLLQDRFITEEKPPSPPQQFTIDELQDMAQKLKEQLETLKGVRQKNIQQLIQLRCSIPPKKYQDYKRLISTSCNVPYENVDMMLAPLLASFDSENE